MNKKIKERENLKMVSDLTDKEKTEMIRLNSLRMWSYLKEAINFIEERYYLNDWYDVNELLAYLKSCEESYDDINVLSYEIESCLSGEEND